MSVPIKVRSTKGDIMIQVGEKRSRLFLVPKDRAEGIVRLLQDFEVKGDDKTIPWHESVQDLIEKYTEAGVALKGARAKAGFSQNELADKLDMPQSHISDMENGRRPIGKKMAKRFADVLHVGYKIFL